MIFTIRPDQHHFILPRCVNDEYVICFEKTHVLVIDRKPVQTANREFEMSLSQYIHIATECATMALAMRHVR